ncbi:MAG: putative rane protein [Planctomycetota bacterium]|nr:putative rane protein [Planctomycetota bacterium]
MQTNNPAFSGTIFGDWEHADRRGNVMTVQGTAGKAMALLVILVACAAVTWTQISNKGVGQGVIIGSLIGGLVFFFATVFNKRWAPVTAPLYAACEGVLLGAISYTYAQAYQGIVPQAVGLTAATTAVMLFVYATGLVKVTGRLTAVIAAATGALALFYLGSMLLGMFGMTGGINLINSSGRLGIVISVVAVGLAAFNLLLDFDFIAQGERYEAPKYMEWYGAFGLMVTLIWLYLEILRLLRKLQDRR